MSDVFLRLVRNAHKIKSEEHLKAWLIVTAQNECKNMLKHWFRSKRTDFEDIAEPSYVTEEDSGVMEKVMSLDEKYRVPIYLYYYEGYSTAEISEMIGINHSTLRTYMAKGREKLKMLLEEEEI